MGQTKCLPHTTIMDNPVILRLDGRHFSKLTKKHFEKPFDTIFAQYMESCAKELMREFYGLYAETHSDEISLLLPRDSRIFDLRPEKLVSLSTSIVTARFVQLSGLTAHFDSRLVDRQWYGVHPYFLERRRSCFVNAVSDALHHYGKGIYSHKDLLNLDTNARISLLESLGYTHLPERFAYGIGLKQEVYEKDGFNPLTKESVKATRRRVVTVNTSGDEYVWTLWGILADGKEDFAL